MRRRLTQQVYLLVVALLVVTSATWAAPGDITVTDPPSATVNIPQPGVLWVEGTAEVPETYTIVLDCNGDGKVTTPVAFGGTWGTQIDITGPCVVEVRLLDGKNKAVGKTATLTVTIAGVAPSLTVAATPSPSPTPSPKASPTPKASTSPTPTKVRLIVLKADYDPVKDQADVVLEAKGVTTVILSSPTIGTWREKVRKDGRVRFAALDLSPNGIRPTPDTYRLTATAYDAKRRMVGDQLTIGIEVPQLPQPPVPLQPSRWEQMRQWVVSHPDSIALVLAAVVFLLIGMRYNRGRRIATPPVVPPQATTPTPVAPNRWAFLRWVRAWFREVDSGRWPPRGAAVQKLPVQIVPAHRSLDGTLSVPGSGPVESTLCVVLDGGEGTIPSARRDGVKVSLGATWDTQFASFEVPQARFRIFVFGTDPAGQPVGPVEYWVEAVEMPAVTLPPLLTAAPSEGAAEESPAPPAPADQAPEVSIDKTSGQTAKRRLFIHGGSKNLVEAQQIRVKLTLPSGADISYEPFGLGQGRWSLTIDGVPTGSYVVEAGVYEGDTSLASASIEVVVREDYVDYLPISPKGERLVFNECDFVSATSLRNGGKGVKEEMIYITVNSAEDEAPKAMGWARVLSDGTWSLHLELPSGEYRVRAAAHQKIGTEQIGEAITVTSKPYAPPPPVGLKHDEIDVPRDVVPLVVSLEGPVVPGEDEVINEEEGIPLLPPPPDEAPPARQLRRRRRSGRRRGRVNIGRTSAEEKGGE